MSYLLYYTSMAVSNIYRHIRQTISYLHFLYFKNIEYANKTFFDGNI